jgi:hypothetical protein
MMRFARKLHQKFPFQKSFPLSVISATIIFGLSQAASAAISAGVAAPAGSPAAAATQTPTPTPTPVPTAAAPAAAPTAASGPTLGDNGAAPDTTVAAQVIWVKGVVKATQGSAPPRVLVRRSPVFEHDVLTTDGSGSGEVAFTDSSVLTLRESTELRVDEYQFKKDASGGGTGKEVMSLVKGGFRTITGAIPKSNPDSYAVNTPVATIGVRGTDYAAYYSKEEGLMAKIFAGRILVKNDQGLVELSKELSHLYAAIKVNEPPKVITKEPVPFATQPPMTPVTKSTINSIGSGGSGDEGPGGGGGGGHGHGGHGGGQAGGGSSGGESSGSGSSGGGSSGGGSGGGGSGGTAPGGSSGGSSSGPNGAPAGTGGGGSSKPVTSFCVGLLKSVSKTINDFFS